MTYKEYLNQENSSRQPYFSVTVKQDEGNYFKEGNQEYCTLYEFGHTYFVTENGNFYTTDDDGNKKYPSVFKKENAG